MIEVIETKLDSRWEDLAHRSGNAYLHRDFLEHSAGTNPYPQHYYLALRDDRPAGILVTHEQSVNLFAMAHALPKAVVPMTFVAPPASVSEPGFHCVDTEVRDRMLGVVASRNRIVVVLNMESQLATPSGWLKVPMLPVCSMPIQWDSFEAYLTSLRSGYRRACRKALVKGSGLTARVLDDAEFTDEHYELYVQVHGKSRYQVEKLDPGYFAGGYGRVVEFVDLSGRICGFVHAYRHGDEYVFGFVGVDYPTNLDYATYQNMLLWMVKDAIESGAERIVFGQTAEDAKCRLGASMSSRVLFLKGGNPLAHSALALAKGLLAYKEPNIDFRVFRGADRT